MNVIKGSIGFLGLTNWWLYELSHNERETIMGVYNPMGSSSKSLTEGSILLTSEEPISLIYGIASWLNNYEDLELCMKLFSKAKSLITESVQAKNVHFLYGNEIKIYYKHRDIIGLEPTITACEQQIKISEEVAHEYISEYLQEMSLVKNKTLDFSRDYSGILPSHIGYKQLST